MENPDFGMVNQIPAPHSKNTSVVRYNFFFIMLLSMPLAVTCRNFREIDGYLVCDLEE